LWNDGNTARLNRVVYPDGGRRVCPQDALETNIGPCAALIAVR